MGRLFIAIAGFVICAVPVWWLTPPPRDSLGIVLGLVGGAAGGFLADMVRAGLVRFLCWWRKPGPPASFFRERLNAVPQPDNGALQQMEEELAQYLPEHPKYGESWVEVASRLASTDRSRAIIPRLEKRLETWATAEVAGANLYAIWDLVARSASWLKDGALGRIVAGMHGYCRNVDDTKTLVDFDKAANAFLAALVTVCRHQPDVALNWLGPALLLADRHVATLYPAAQRLVIAVASSDRRSHPNDPRVGGLREGLLATWPLKVSEASEQHVRRSLCAMALLLDGRREENHTQYRNDSERVILHDRPLAATCRSEDGKYSADGWITNRSRNGLFIAMRGGTGRVVGCGPSAILHKDRPVDRKTVNVDGVEFESLMITCKVADESTVVMRGIPVHLIDVPGLAGATWGMGIHVASFDEGESAWALLR